jgi:hypothetical protein
MSSIELVSSPMSSWELRTLFWLLPTEVRALTILLL